MAFPLYVEVDEIYNLACPASPIHYQRDPVRNGLVRTIDYFDRPLSDEGVVKSLAGPAGGRTAGPATT